MAVKYGTMKTVISGLTVVLPNGDIINTGSRTKKTSAGYNLTNLFIGSEGTLGIITEVQLRLSPIPESIMSAVCHFPTLEDAVKTAQEVIQYGIPIARIEMLNKDQMGISINYSKLKDIEAVPTLFFEFHGSEASNNENIKIVEEISKEKPESIIRSKIEVAVGMQSFQARELAFGLGIEPDLIRRASETIIGCYKAFSELDATMVEVNPLVISKQNKF